VTVGADTKDLQGLFFIKLLIREDLFGRVAYILLRLGRVLFANRSGRRFCGRLARRQHQ
jgi:hypothetical protein